MLRLCIFLGATFVLPAVSRTVHSVLVFSHHGDRTSKVFPGYQMTNLGAQQCYNSGSLYRDLYIADGAPSQIRGVSSTRAEHAQLWASAPDQSVLFQTAANFLQGLYPPLGTLDTDVAAEELANGTSTEAPLDGYQYIHIQGEADNAPDTIWLKGDDECPAYTRAAKSYRQSREYQDTLRSTDDFYTQFEGLLAPILGAENVSYASAYDVFDLLNTAKIHNGSIADQISEENLVQARYLADAWEFNMNYNASLPDRSIGGAALLGGMIRRIQAVVDDRARTKFSLMTGSYDTFLAFFGIMGLPAVNPDFYGLPDYASTIAFELYSEPDNAPFPEANVDGALMVRFLFRNGTDADAELTSFPLAGLSAGNDGGVSYGAFMNRLQDQAISSVGAWCQRCGSEAEFCRSANATTNQGEASLAGGRAFESHSDGLSAAAAGAIGAAVTLAVVGLVAVLLWALRRRSGRNQIAMHHAGEKRIGSDSDSA